MTNSRRFSMANLPARGAVAKGRIVESPGLLCNDSLMKMQMDTSSLHYAMHPTRHSDEHREVLVRQSCWVLLAIAFQCGNVTHAVDVLSSCELPGVKRAAKCGVMEVPENWD